jgi:hypothetical protein
MKKPNLKSNCIENSNIIMKYVESSNDFNIFLIQFKGNLHWCYSNSTTFHLIKTMNEIILFIIVEIDAWIINNYKKTSKLIVISQGNRGNSKFVGIFIRKFD